VALKRLKIQGGGPQGIPGLFGISAKGGLKNTVHHVLIEDCIISDGNTSQGAVGISTKTPTWGWTIRRNKIINCGTGLTSATPTAMSPSSEVSSKTIWFRIPSVTAWRSSFRIHGPPWIRSHKAWKHVHPAQCVHQKRCGQP